ncbi:D-alanine--D-alanine ligase family protein [Thermasporomyces composti]|jgi:D-alanine-D-alanine ligase|uniref:D-alanine--D-alanine ligase n=1 Tax=Thermasporomyces composti TaxID=696763 RepID=A0A3D9VAR0_THECX|nr:D-alanine--D-alanine ligase family protein [Thermasporomyces composti]REF35234.1 D-alanine--D-alanine ligase [Thermasporomyces composti]
MSELERSPDTRDGATGSKPRVAVVFGGRSSEHAVSCVTAGSVLRALDRDKYDVVPIGITTDGRWVLERDEPERLVIQAGRLPEVDEKGTAVVLANDDERGLVCLDPAAGPTALGRIDVVFPVLHGPFGEDGTLQGLLEMAGVRYVGAGVLASAVAMDKHYAKLILQANGFPVAPYTVITRRAWETDRAACQEAVDSLGYPVFVKPARGGSSIGITKVRQRADLPEAVEEARRYDPKVVVEAAVLNAREIECGVLESLDGGRPEASVVAEICYDTEYEFYDFQAKYLDDETHVDLRLPADLEPSVAQEVQDMAIRAFEALSVEGLARVDFFLREDGTLLLNEINTMPGFTPYSMFPRMWAASGLDYPSLVDRLVQLALRRPLGLR